MRRLIYKFIIWLLLLASLFFLVKSSDDPLPLILHDTVFESLLQRFSTGNAVIFNISVGIIVSLFFYFLIVWIPETSRKKILIHNFLELYDYFKEDTICILLDASGEQYCNGLTTELKSFSKFRKYFQEAVSESKTRWHIVFDGLTEKNLQEILSELDILLSEVSFILNSSYIDDKDVFLFLKRLSMNVHKLRRSSLNDTDLKSLSDFIWELFAGWSLITGAHRHDIIKHMISKI